MRKKTRKKSEARRGTESNFLEVAIAVLKQEGRPMTPMQICETALSQNLLHTNSKYPQNTMNASLNRSIKKHGEASPFVKVSSGLYSLSSKQSVT